MADTRGLDAVLRVRERVSAALIELDQSVAHRILQGARLTGTTRARWERARDDLADVWRVFDAYRRTLDLAEAARGDPAALGPLLGGPSVEVEPVRTGTAAGGLLGPAPERITVDAAVRRMSEGFDRAAATVKEADAAWSRLLPELRALEAARGAAAEAAERLGARGSWSRLDADATAAAAEAVRTDPLGADAACLARLRAEAERLLAALREAEPLSRGSEAARAKVGGPPPGPVPDPGALRELLRRFDDRCARGAWTDAADAAADLRARTGEARRRARTAARAAEGLLERRAELRGRLEAYRMKAARLGGGEDPCLARLRRAAREELWSAPCDLRTATAALDRYRAALAEHERSGGTGP